MDNHKLGSSMRTNVVKLHNMSIKKKLQHSLAGSQSANDGQPRPEKNLDLKKSFLKVYRTKTEDMKI